MAKIKWIIFALLFITVPALPLSLQAESIKKAGPDDIHMLLNAASGENSAYWATYIGETRGRIYIEYATAVHASSPWSDKPKYVVYWLPRSELSEAQLQSFKLYKSKFADWQ